MRVLRATACGHLELDEAPEPVIGEGEALIQLESCGLCGTDLYKLADRNRGAGEVLGHEVVGRVIESRTDALDRGDRVVAPHHAACGRCRLCRAGTETMCPAFKENLLDPGGFSERVRLSKRAVERTVRRVGDTLAVEAAVFVEPAACVLRGINRAELSDTDPLAVVIGAGSMGLLHLFMLRALYPGIRVVVVELDPGRRATALELGAQAVVAPGAEAEIDADAAFDTAGGQAALDTALAAIRPGGRVVVFAHAPAEGRVEIDLNTLFRSEQMIVGAYSGSAAEQERVLELLRSGALRPQALVTHRLPFERAGEAVELCRRREALKILFYP